MAIFSFCKLQSICKSGVFVLMLFLMFQGKLSAQDSILFLNGQEFSGKILEDIGDYYKMQLSVKHGKKTKIFAVDKEMIFKIKWKDSTTIYYLPDSANINDLSISEMQMYIRGEQFAMANYRPWISPVSAFVTGMSGAYLGFWGFTIPAIHLGIESLYSPALRSKISVKTKLSSDSSFVMGYRDTGRKIRNKRMARCAIGGLITGWTIKVLIGGLD